MNFLWTTITVQNLDESIQFYTNIIGLTVTSRFFAGPSVEIAFLKDTRTEAPILELLQNSAEEAEVISGNPTLGFEIESFDESFQAIRKNGIAIIGETSETPKFKWFTIQDPNGMYISLFQEK